jgi:amino acid adenylation domain-containing protein
VIVALEEAERVTLVLSHDSDLFESGFPGTVLGHLAVILERVAAEPQRRLDDLSILTPEETERLASWRRTAVPFQTDQCVHDLVWEQAAAQPARTAVAFHPPSGRAPVTLTYAELISRVTGTARRLRRCGVGRGTFVGVCLERSTDLVITILAVLKAGGAFVPLDPSHPPDRLAWLVADSGTPVIVTTDRLSECLSQVGDVEIFDLADQGTHEPPEGNESGAPLSVRSTDPAYMIYTSGSTGRPKGVVVGHRSLVNTLTALAAKLPFGADDGFVLNSSPSFDVSIAEFLLPLLVGGRVIVGDHAAGLDASELMRLIAASGATYLQATPSVWTHLLDMNWRGGPGLTAVTVGEALTSHLAVAILERTERLWNLYGPTEAAIYATGLLVARGAEPGSIGRPIANMRAYVLDESGRQVPPGVWGELHLGGVGIAHGYHARPDLTVARFVPDPFAPSDERRAIMYRTGDVARFRWDGGLEFRGRIDDQIKVNGVRIEPGEVEWALKGLDSVEQAAVAVRENGFGSKRLVAYLVPRGRLPDDATLRRLLGARLPQAMVPSIFMAIPALPLTPSGKLDRAALPSPDEADGPRPYREPLGPAEQTLAKIFGEVLGLGRIGADDDFFDLGGDSLKGMQIVSRTRERLGADLRIRDLFDHPTVARLASRAGRVPPRPNLGTDAALGDDRVISFAQERLWLLNELGSASARHTVTMCLLLEGDLNPRLLGQSLEAVVQRHECLRTTFHRRDGLPVPEVATAGGVDLPVTDLSDLEGRERQTVRDNLAASWNQESFDLEHGPLLRAHLLRFGPASHELWLVMHHTISDGWSVSVITDDLLERVMNR